MSKRDWLAETVDERFKGFSPSVRGRRLGNLVRDGATLFDGTFTLPVMVLKSAALRHNIETMADYCREQGVELAPHGKTTMAPQLFERQLAAGAWAITAATPAQVGVCRTFGVPRVLLANQLVDRGATEWIVRELDGDPAFDFLCYVDSVAGVELLADAVGTRTGKRPLDLLVEMGHAGGRTGCRTPDQARAIARAAAAIEGLRIVGVAGFEGGLGHELTPAVLDAVDSFLEAIHSAAATLADEGLIVDRGEGIILSAGGSIFFDRVPAVLTRPLPGGRSSLCVLRSGCYVSHDSGLYERLSPFTRPGSDGRRRLQPALEVWGQVLSTPENGLAIVGIGRRDVSFDQGLPVPQAIRRPGSAAFADAGSCSVRILNDQHAFVDAPVGTDVAIGDWMSFGISHPCTSFNKWRLLPEVDEDYRVVDFVHTYF
jgi:D-serine deaminase-like pyridoxal phosphate-dependent protein